MISITIDGKSVSALEGTTILNAAESIGIKIPTLCYLKEISPLTSCMVCVVRVNDRKNLLPACATKVEEGMVVLNDDPEVASARRTALELLLSDHVGDCIGPCQVACPAGMDIPGMIRYIDQGSFEKAIETIKKDIALPAVTGYICTAPCEKTCRRGQVDQSITIRLLKRYTAELDLSNASPFKPEVSPDQNKKVAIVGSGPAGLAVAYYLQQAGISCTVFDDREEPGGMLRYGVPKEELPREVLDKEIDQIRRLGAVFKQGARIGQDHSLKNLQETFDAVFLGPGNITENDLTALGLDKEQLPLKVDKNSMQTTIPGVFAGGDVRRKSKLAVRSLADGKNAAESIARFLEDKEVFKPLRPFNISMGKLEPEELDQLADSNEHDAPVQSCDQQTGLNNEQAHKETKRCLHCDCRKADSCKLRIYAEDFGARTTRYRGKRRKFTRSNDHLEVVHEPGKCISCGICVKITEKQREALGLTFIGRGFDVKVAVPFDRSIKEGLTATAREVVNACPTGALAFK